MSDSDIILYLVLLFICILLSGFFSSSEVAFVSLQKLRLRHLANTEGGAAKQVDKLAQQPERLLTTILLGNNLVNTAAAAIATVIAVSMLPEGYAVLAATASITIVLLVFGEVFPKTVATRYGERLAMLYAAPMRILTWILAPVAAIFVWIGDKLARLVGASQAPQALVSEGEIRTAVSVGVEEGTLVESEAEMVERVFRFGDRQVDEVMTPRPDISWAEKGTNLGEFLSIYAQYPHSRFPIYEDTIDNVIGVLWIKDVLMAQANGEIDKDSLIDDLARPAYFIPESKLIAELFAELQETGGQIAIVVDEFGGTAGLVTMEKLLEEIVGEFGDELALAGKSYEAIDENNFQISGSMRLDDANERLNIELPEGEYETVAGFVLSVFGHIPKEGEQLRINNVKLVITEMKGVKIEKILVTKE